MEVTLLKYSDEILDRPLSNDVGRVAVALTCYVKNGCQFGNACKEVNTCFGVGNDD